MKFTISLDQRNYLHNTGYIPFYDLLNAAELKILSELPTKKQRDLWRTQAPLKQIVFSKRLAELVFELTQKKPLRLAYDQYIPERLHYEEQDPLKEIFGSEPLQNRTSISSLIGALLIGIKTSESYFILPTCAFPYESLEPHPFFMIAYGDSHSQYLYETRDPENHYLKSLGYVFGDHLKDNLHPILLR